MTQRADILDAVVYNPLFDFRREELDRLKALPADRAIADAAASRDGVLDHRQLSALGLSGSAITRRVQRGLLFVRHRGVYAAGRADLTLRGEVRAALLRCGRGAVLSHRTAAWLLDLLGARRRIDVTITGRAAAPGHGSSIKLHYTSRWLPREVVWIDGFPCTSVARTLADLAGTSPAKEFGWAWDNADQQVLIDLRQITAQIARRRAGAAVLRGRLEHHNEAPPTESVLEELFLELCRSCSIRAPVCQWPLAAEDRRGRVDFVWVPERVAVEVDGRRWHAIQSAHDRDREKDLALRDAGFDPHRYVYRQVRDEGPRVGRIVRSALGSSRVRG